MRSALHKKFLPPFKGGGVDPLLVDLESYWTLDELSGTRYDSIGSNDLTDNNTVTYVNDGPRGVSAKFVLANGEFLSRADGAEFDFFSSGSWTIAGWVKPDTLAASAGLVSKDDVGANREFYSALAASGALSLSTNAGADVSTANVAELDTWNFFVVWWDNGGATANVQLNTGTIASGASGGAPTNKAAPLWVGGIGSGFTAYLNGKMGRVGVWNKVLSAPERLELYNAGRAKSYSDLSPGIKTNLVSYWNLDEVSLGGGAVTRNDSHGTNHLTDNNTVMSIETGPEAVVAKFSVDALESLSCNYVGPTTYTVAMWVRKTVLDSKSSTVFCMKEGVLCNIYVSSADPAFGSIYCSISLYNGSNWFISGAWVGNIAMDPGWIFIFATCDNNSKEIKMFANGIQVGTTTPFTGTPGNFAAADNIVIGLASIHPYPANDDATADAQIGSVGLWDRVLNAGEMATLFNNGVALKYSELSAGIKTNLVSYWNLTELSGNRADSHGANTLTDNNTVMSVINMPDVADKVAAKFVVASTEFLDRANVALPASYTISLWAKFVSPGAFSGIIMCPDNGVSAQLSFYYQAANAVVIGVGDGTTFRFQSKPGITDNEWWHFIIVYDAATQVITLYTNDDAGIGPAALPNPRSAGPSTLVLGAFSGGSWPLGGQIDEVAIWSRILTAPERTRLFNLGKGIFYPTFTP